MREKGDSDYGIKVSRRGFVLTLPHSTLKHMKFLLLYLCRRKFACKAKPLSHESWQTLAPPVLGR